MKVAVKRVYDPPALSDGVRVLVDRLWPRGLTKEKAAVKHWLRDLSPSDELRKWYHANPGAWAMFRRKYLKELSAPQATEAVEELYQLAGKNKTITLLYASRIQERNNATVLKEHLEGAPKPPSSVGRAATGRERIRKANRL
jgi:uncharacterized protein YeaO (DUF488 family)